MLVFVLVLVGGPGAVSGDMGSTAHAHESSGEQAAAGDCTPAAHSSSPHASSCGGSATAILHGSISFTGPLNPQQAPLFAEALYISLAVDRLERPPAASSA